MTKYSKLNFVYRMQKWMDSVPGQTFLNYAYSWGAAIVILGTLFKLTHLPGANFFLFLGMGTEVVVFFLSAFDRPFDKTTDGMELEIHPGEGVEGVAAPVVVGAATGGGGVNGETVDHSGGGGVIGGGVIGGGSGGTIVINGGGGGAESGVIVNGETVDHSEGGIIGGGGIIGISGGVGGGVVNGGTVDHSGGGGAATAEEPMPMGEELKQATSNYIDELNRLSEMLSEVSEQSKRLRADSEEMENLNRTLTGISRVYEMQLKSASSQMGTIDEINEQTRHMAQQIAELNRIYARMIEAMQIKAAGPLS